jgi:hypothetical protein
VINQISNTQDVVSMILWDLVQFGAFITASHYLTLGLGHYFLRDKIVKCRQIDIYEDKIR